MTGRLKRGFVRNVYSEVPDGLFLCANIDIVSLRQHPKDKLAGTEISSSIDTGLTDEESNGEVLGPGIRQVLTDFSQGLNKADI